MYTVVTAIGVKFGLNQRWQVIDLTFYTVAQLYSVFRRVQITLVPTGSEVPVYLDLTTIASTYSTYNFTFAVLLASLNNAALPTTPTGISLNKNSALYKDAFKAGFTITPVSASNVVSPVVPTTSLPNLRLTRSDIKIDYTYFQANCLVNVNGYYHQTSTDGINGVMVTDGMESLLRSNQNQLAIWNFSSVGPVTVLPITPEMISTTSPGTPTAPLITLTEPINNQALFLVLGGYMVFVDGAILTQLSGSTFQLNFALIDLVNRYYESINYINIDSVLAGTPPVNPNQVVIADLTTPTAIAAWLALSQTFFVAIDNPEVYMQKQAIKHIGTPNQYITYQKPTSPLVLALGRQPPYWDVQDDRQWLLSVYDNNIGNLLYYTTTSGVSTSGSCQPGTPGNLQEAFLLEIGCDIS